MFVSSDSYRSFRKLVIHVVLATDVTSPERLQLSASMFQEAFPDYFSDEENDDEEYNPQNLSNEYIPDDYLDNDVLDYDADEHFVGRRSSITGRGIAVSSRRGSMNSVASDITMDSYTRQVKYKQVDRLNAQNKYGYGSIDDRRPRRNSLSSMGDFTERSEGDSMMLHARHVPRTTQQQQQQTLMRKNSMESRVTE